MSFWNDLKDRGIALLNSTGDGIEWLTSFNGAVPVHLSASDVPQGREDVIHLPGTLDCSSGASVFLIPDTSEYMEMSWNAVIAGGTTGGAIAIAGTHDAAQAVFGNDLVFVNDNSTTPATRLASFDTATGTYSGSVDLRGQTRVKFYVKTTSGTGTVTLNISLRGAR